MKLNEITITVEEPYSILPHLHLFSISGKPVPCIIHNNEYWRLIKIDDDLLPFLAFINESAGKIKISYGGPEEEIIKIANHIFSLDVKYQKFLDVLENYPILYSIAKKYKGLRPARNLNIYESLIKTVLQQRVNLNFALSITAKIVENYGPKMKIGSRVFYSFPSPQTFVDLDEKTLKSLGMSSMKAKSIIEIAKLENNKSLPSLEHIERSPNKYVEKLMEIYGVGKWTAELAIASVIHDFSIGPAGDLNVMKGFSSILGVEGETEIREYTKKFTKWRGLIMYLIALEMENQKIK